MVRPDRSTPADTIHPHRHEHVGGGSDERRFTNATPEAAEPAPAPSQPQSQVNGTSGHDTLYSTSANDTIYAQEGNDLIDGGLGSDTISGGAGDDVFIFNTALGSNNVDYITDFTVNYDKIALDAGWVFKGIHTNGALDSKNFVVGTAATTVDQHII